MIVGKFLNTFRKSILVVMAGMLFFACKKNPGNKPKVDFDRQAMLVNWADNIIIPAYASFEQSLTDFRQSVDVLAANKTPLQLQDTREKFKQLYLDFQIIKVYEVGPAQNLSYRASLNTYPADTSQILMNITTGGYNLGAASNVDAKGLPALDYLLFEKANLLLQDSASFKYLDDCLNEMETLTNAVVTGWASYRTNFVSATGTDMGSSLGQVVNALNKDYELIKNAKIGFPAGKKTLGQTYPHACEAYYSGISKDLIITNLQSIFDLFRGMYHNGTGKGSSLEDYLKELNFQNNGTPLYEDINNQFAIAIQAVNDIPGIFSIAVDQEKPAVDKAYLEVQKNIVLLKVDMPSALGVLITYQDNDGD